MYFSKVQEGHNTSWYYFSNCSSRGCSNRFHSREPASDGRENILVITDVLTKWTIAVPTRDQMATTVARVLSCEWFSQYGAQKRLHSDQDLDFEGRVVQALCQVYGVTSSRTTPYRPQANGQARGSTGLYMDFCGP